MANKRKTTTAIIAGITAVAMLLGGTFAWTSISQEAMNETAGIVNVGGRLHDDFNGTNKDVYVENFTDPLNGGQPIYARIKLTEYMEVGQDAGGTDDGDGKPEAVPVVDGTNIDDEDNWKVFIPGSIDDTTITCADCAGTTGTECGIHNYWKWTVSGNKTFMPTFNKDKDSLEADINGTYHGTNNQDKIYYDDYVTYVTQNGAVVDVINGTVDDTAVTIPASTTANALTEANKDVTTVTGIAYYDDDTNADENDHTNGTGVRPATETHTAKQTGTAEVITMETWLADVANGGKGGQPGNYWVYDTDGWAYWANPIMPGEATGLLLDSIEMTKNPGEKCYYAINVVAQFATVGDWEYFDGTEENGTFDGTDNAKNLLETVSENVTIVTVTNNGPTTLSTVVDAEAGTTNTTTFTATAAKVGDSTATAADAEFTWAVYDADLNPVTTSTITQDGVLTIGKNEQNKNLIIAATHTESGAVGLASVAVDVVILYDEATLAIINQIATMEAVGSTASGGTGKDIYKEGTSLPMVTIDSEQYFVVVKDETHGAERALLLKFNSHTFNYVSGGYTSYTKYGNSTSYAESDVYALLNSTEPVTIKTSSYVSYSDVSEVTVTPFLAENTTVAQIAIPTEISTRVYDAEGNYTYETTTCQVFVMSEADVSGTIGGVATSNTEDYTYVLNGQGVDLFDHNLSGEYTGGAYASYVYGWLRSTYTADTVGYLLYNNSVVGNYPQGGYEEWFYDSSTNYYYGYVFPMFWADISAADVYNN